METPFFSPLLRFTASTLNDLTCTGTATVPNDNTIWRAATDIYIFIDTTWFFRDIQSMIGWDKFVCNNDSTRSKWRSLCAEPNPWLGCLHSWDSSEKVLKLVCISNRYEHWWLPAAIMVNIKFINFPLRLKTRAINFNNASVCFISYFLEHIWTFTICRHLLSSLDVGRFGTTYTILNAMNGAVIVNTTNQLSDFYRNWNQSTHDNRTLNDIHIFLSLSRPPFTDPPPLIDN